MAHVVEAATSGRAKCRACGETLAKGAVRLGERLPNLFGEGEMTYWYHPACAAYKRPQLYVEAVEAGAQGLGAEQETLGAIAKQGVAHHRLARINGLERAPTARAHCRQCRELIDRGAWRIPLVYYEEGRFGAAGYLHLSCAQPYFKTREVLDRLRHFAPNLTDSDFEEVRAQLG